MSTAEIMLTIFFVRMPVKFPCKMSLHYDSKVISQEVSPNDGQFTFDLQAKISVNKTENLQINAYLTTGKGSSILAGNISISMQSLSAKEGEQFTIPLQKCIDSSAVCELKINHVSMMEQKPSNANLARSLAGGNYLRSGSPNRHSPKLKTLGNDKNETRSQFQGNLLKRGGVGSVINKQPQKFNFAGKPKNISRDLYSKFDIHERIQDPFLDDLRETRTIAGGSASVRRRERDRERLASKKIADETENNLKMDIMKYKMKAEETEKTVNDKTKQVKALKDQILEFQRKNIEKAFMEEEMTSKDNTIRMLEDRISTVNSENASLRETITEHLKTINELKESIRFDVLKNKEEYDRKEQQLKFDMNISKNQIAQLQQQLGNKASQLLKAKKYIEDLESGAQQKIFQHDRIIQELKKQQIGVVKGLKHKNSELEARIEELMKQLSNKKQVIQKKSDQIAKLENSDRNKDQLNQGLEVEKKQLLKYKTDFLNLSKKYTKLQEQLKEEQRHNKKNMQSKNKQISELQAQITKLTKMSESKLNTAQQKNKQLKSKIVELDNNIIAQKNEQDKLKKIIDKLERNSIQHTSKIANLQKQLKSTQNKLQTNIKTLTQKENNSHHLDSLHKMQMEHTRQSLQSITKQYEQLSSKYSQTKQNLQLTKNQRTKLQNKIQLLDQNISRLNEYIKEKKEEYDTKQTQFRNTIQQLNGRLKKVEEQDKNKQKELNACEIKELNLKNKIERLDKVIEETNAKIDKMDKVTIPKLHEEKENTQRQLDMTKEKLAEALEENKFITSERTKLESETNKNTKINSVLNQEKIIAMNELNKMKNIIAKAQKKQQKLNADLKSANEEIKKLTIRIEQLNKDSLKNKDTLNETINNLILARKSTTSGNFIGMKDSGYVNARNLASSRVTGHKGFDSISASDTFDIRRIVEVIESTNKQQQSTITLLQQNINHYKESLNKLQKQLATVSFTSKSTEQKMQETINQLAEQLEILHDKLLSNSNQYEDKISKLETQLGKKQKDFKMHKSTIGSLKYQIESLNQKIELMMDEGELRDNRANEKVEELNNQLNFNEMDKQALENEKKKLQNTLYETEEALASEKQQNHRKDNYISETIQKFNFLKLQHEQTTRIKKQQLEKLLSLKQEFDAVKEDSIKTKEMLRQQQNKNKKLQEFINELLKQKQNIVKIQLKSSSRVNQLEGQLIETKNSIENLEILIKQKDQQITQLKSSMKANQSQIKNLDSQLKEQRAKVSQFSIKNQQKDKKLIEKQYEISQLTTQMNNSISHLKVQLANCKQDMQDFKGKSMMSQQQRNTRIMDLEKQISEQEAQIHSMKMQIQQKEQQIFFEKQRASLSQSAINDLKKQNSQTALIISKYQAQLNQLSQQLTFKEETLYEYSGKLYQLQQQIQAKQAEGEMKAEKIDIDWQCRHDQICEEYQQKIEYLQKDKQYLKQKLTLLEQERSKILQEKQQSTEILEKDLGSYKIRQKQIEAEKLQKINEKNKQIEKLKLEVTSLTNKLNSSQLELKKKNNEVHAKDQAIKKLEQKVTEHDQNLIQKTKQFQKDLNGLKKGENSLKILKQEIKNAQWVTERQVKKITQIFIQRVISACPEAKDKLVEPIRSLEASMSSAINFKI